MMADPIKGQDPLSYYKYFDDLERKTAHNGSSLNSKPFKASWGNILSTYSFIYLPGL